MSNQAATNPATNTNVNIAEARKVNKRENRLYKGVIRLENGLVTAPAISERFRALRAKIERLNLGQDIYQLIAVTSSLPGEGKSLIAANLARALSIDPLGKTLLIDADLRRPSVHNFFELDVSPGVSDFLAGNCSYQDIIREQARGLDVVTAGTLNSDPTSLIESPVFSRLLNRLRYDYRYIIVDCPPVHYCSEPITISSIADGTFVVVRAWHSQKRVVRDMVKSIGKENVLGVIMNDGHDTSRQYYDYGYYGYRSETEPKSASA